MFTSSYLEPNLIHPGDARTLLKEMMPESVALSFWSPPYCLGKSYESHLNFREWATLLEQTIAAHYPVIKAGGFSGD